MNRPDIDPHDRRMNALVHPPEWAVLPSEEGYDLAVIGGGTGGLVAASGAGLSGARTLLIEADRLGGDCLVHGCVPSKALLHAAQVAHDVARADRWGIQVEATVDFAQVMSRVRGIRADIAHDDSAEVLASRGVDVVFGRAVFTGPRSLEVDGRPVRFKRAMVATGARPRMLDIAGLREHALTNETVFDLDELPAHLVVLGGGPIGCELAQAFARLGSRVTLVELGDRLLPVDDPEASAVLLEALREDGVDVRLNAQVVAVRKEERGLAVTVERGGDAEELVSDHILVAVGREPNVEGLGLDRAGVRHGRGGIEVDRWQRTSNRRIYAVGDVAQGPNFTHAAFAQAATATMRALVPFVAKTPRSPMSWVTYTDPAVAHVGLRPAELRALANDVHTVSLPMDHVDRARTDGDARGFGKIHLKRGSDQILAATFVGHDAGELIAEVALAMANNLGLGAVVGTIHPYPTRSWLTLQLATEHDLGRLTPRAKGWLQRWFAWGLR